VPQLLPDCIVAMRMASAGRFSDVGERNDGWLLYFVPENASRIFYVHINRLLANLAQMKGMGGMMGGMMGGGGRDPNLKNLEPNKRVKAITYCRDTYRVTTADEKTRAFWERNLRFRTDSSKDGPEKGAPAITPAGMMGDRAAVIFAAPEEITKMIEDRCWSARYWLMPKSKSKALHVAIFRARHRSQSENNGGARRTCGLGLSRHGHAVVWEREWYHLFRFRKLERADLSTKEFGGEPILAAIGIRIARSQVSATCVRVELSAIAGVFDHGLRVYVTHERRSK
jgi:hypothetical protein